MPEKYIGQIVRIIYQDAKGRITQRTIRVNRIVDGRILAYDFDKRAPRPFRIDRILAMQPVGRTA
ncbi:WYL domain-containing protein [Cohnella cholangitidis]|uniref:WYL domain-containing protein n=1 Tax=Cohnella cholangitidis TaxID=2598458 RepID=A0A7G5BTE0_9BACL|nr:WYL domain-containing protein [Cohnella cholangitidis]